MKAYVLHGIGDLRYEEWKDPVCGPEEVIVAVKAVGICASDIPRIFWKGAYHFPLIPGHEVSGVVVETGGRADRAWLGRRVSVFPLIPCQNCPPCKEGCYELCGHYDYIGSRRDGGFAEYMAVPAWNLIELPENVSYPAGALAEPLAVALHAVKRAGDVAGRSVAVVGSGMIGIAAGRWAKLLGARKVRIVGRSEKKRAFVEQENGLGYCSALCEALSEKSDVVIEAVGSADAAETAIRLAGSGADVVLMGNPEGDICLKQDIYWQILRRQLHLSGTWNSSYGTGGSDWAETMRVLEKGEIRAKELITHCFVQERLPEGLELMRTHARPYGKVMTSWNREA